MHTYYFEFTNEDGSYMQRGETTAPSIDLALQTAMNWVAQDWEGMHVTLIREGEA